MNKFECFSKLIYSTNSLIFQSPLLIGTHPTSQRPFASRNSSIRTNSEDVKVVPQFEGNSPMEFGAPPSYEEPGNGQHQQMMPALENIPPPSYAQSVAGLSAIGSEHGQQAMNNLFFIKIKPTTKIFSEKKLFNSQYFSSFSSQIKSFSAK